MFLDSWLGSISTAMRIRASGERISWLTPTAICLRDSICCWIRSAMEFMALANSPISSLVLFPIRLLNLPPLSSRENLVRAESGLISSRTKSALITISATQHVSGQRWTARWGQIQCGYIRGRGRLAMVLRDLCLAFGPNLVFRESIGVWCVSSY